MTHPTEPRVEVTQADREAACALRIYTTSLSDNDYRAKEARETFLTGKRDSWEIVQAFARHRTAAEAASRAREDALREALERIATVDMGGGFLGAQACREIARAALSPTATGEGQP